MEKDVLQGLYALCVYVLYPIISCWQQQRTRGGSNGLAQGRICLVRC